MIKVEFKNNSVVEVEEGQFLDVSLDQNILTFSSNGVVLSKIEAGEAKTAFKRRKQLKAVVHEVYNSQVTVQVVRWADLHRHSGYSLLKSSSKIKDIVERTEYVGALTDNGAMFGAVDYFKQMKKAGKKPIIGYEAYTESIDGEKYNYPLVLLAMSEAGFKNLVKLTSVSYEHHFESPQVSYDMLKSHSEGVLALSGDLNGEIPKLLKRNDYEGAKKVATTLASIFGKENFYLEIQRHGIQHEDQINKQLLKLGKELDLKVAGAVNSHYTNVEDSEEQDILLCLSEGTTMDDQNRFMMEGEGFHLHTADEVEELFADIPEVLDVTLEIAEKCNLEIELGKVYLPHFDVPVLFKSESAYFEHLCWKGFEERYTGSYKLTDKEYKERLQFEIDTINKMGFPGYFLIVWDFVRFAKENDILVGPGRGSACGSLVAYALNITEVDPIEYGLLFERFLNPDRISMPDIDLDFDDLRREEVIDYVKEKYGENAVSRIITFGTLAARAVVRDVTRVTGSPYSLGDRIAKSIPAVPKMTLKKAMVESVEFKKMYDEESDVRDIVDKAMKLEGLPRNISQHACGVIIAPSAVTDYIPQIIVENEKTGLKEATTQVTMAECEEMGLLKMDFLGLRTMGVVGRALQDINPRRKAEGKEEIDFLSIPTDDVKVYDFISKGNTEGVFQLESGGMTSFMKELFQDAHSYLSLKDQSQLKKIGRQLFERTIAGISLYRPGPIDEIPNYVNNMLNHDYIKYDTPELKPILENTYGIIVYQEQVMFIVRELAGFSKGQADTIRKAMGKKKTEILDEYEQYFVYGSKEHTIKGCIANNISEEVAKTLWEKMKKFGLYAFNKSHAGGYAEIAVRTAWLSYYYPTEYMTATLNSIITKSDRIKIYLSVCKKKGIEVLPPDVNKSREAFTVDGSAIRFGLMGIKNMGKVSKDVMKERDARGEFKDFQDFAERMAIHYQVNKRMLEALVYSGAVDGFEGTRKAKLSVLPKILDSASIEKKNHAMGQLDLFSMSDEFADFKKVVIPEMEEFDKKWKLEKEKEFAGFYVTEHPLDEYVEYFEREGVYEIGFLTPKEDDLIDEDGEELTSYNYDGETVKIAGIIKDLKIFYTKKDQKPLYVFQVEDKTGDMKAVIFADRIELNQDKLVEGKVVIVQGKVKQDDFGVQVMVQNMFDIEALVKSEKPKAVWVKISQKSQFDEVVQIAKENPGDLPVFIYYNEKAYKAKETIDLNFVTFSKLQELFGENVKVTYNK
ncbi:DNA polymerase III subunit alpha [Bacillus sp. M6-12]|uniref:DNA polymerase III subunit alpha n=1 Tax=Bacillus sp. M6-12 TaxID=2054166 RepID=UPI002155165F|nr:DNA polymerase III subunit alpha [Bacillus sp. M6-12]